MFRLTVATALTSLLLLHAPLNSAGDTTIPLASFDTSPGSQPWTTVNDPVMGGGSNSTITVTSGVGVWEGEVRIVQSLGKPGFCTVRTGDTTKGYDDDSESFPDATGTKYLVVGLAGLPSGLSVNKFSVNISLKGKRRMEGGYQAKLSKKRCCGNECHVRWDDFKMSWRGKNKRGEKVSDKLDQISRIGLSTSGTAGKFSLSIKSFSATDNVTPCNGGELEWS